MIGLLHDRRIGSRLFGTFFIMLTMLGTVAIVAVVKLGSVRHLVSKEAERAVYMRATSSRLVSLISDIRASLAEGQMSNGGRQRFLLLLDEADRECRDIRQSLGLSSGASPEMASYAGELEAILAQLRARVSRGGRLEPGDYGAALDSLSDRLSDLGLSAVEDVSREVSESVDGAARFTLVLLGIASLLGLLLALTQGASITTRIAQITRVSREVARGNFHAFAPVSPKADDEINELNETFNLMTFELGKMQEEIQQYSRTLQEKVEDRTRELRESNQQVRKTMEQLARSNQQMVQALRVRGEFLGNMSHELCTPLNAIIGFSQILLDGSCGPVTDEQQEFLRDILHGAEHLLRMITDLLDLAKIEAGRVTLNRSAVDINFWLFNATKFIKPQADSKHIELVVDVPDDIGEVYADQTRLNQIMINLYSNAVKFTPEGGRITTRAWKDERMLHVSVSDTGIGISPAHHERIFEAFEQVEQGTDREKSGAGLGLALVKNFVELHDGRISVESELGKGSTFTFTIPLLQSESAPAAAPAPKSSEVAPGVKVVLVASANESLNDMVEVYLHEVGYHVEKALPGEQALSAALGLRPFAIIHDFDSQDPKALSYIEMIARNKETRTIPMLIVVDKIDRATAARLAKFQAVETMVKPLDRFSLICALANLTVEETKEESRPLSSVLVAEGDALARRVLAAALRGGGFQVRDCGDSRSCLDIAASDRPDAIVLDIDLPPHGAFDTMVDLRRRPWSASIPLIVLTGRKLKDEEEDFLSGKVVQVIQKGLSMKEETISLLNNLFAHIEPHRAPAAGEFGTWSAESRHSPPPT